MAILEFLHSSPFFELAILLVMTAGLGILGMALRQPMIVSYIVVGVLAGPSFFGIVRSHDMIDQLSQLSIAVLLFLVGLKLDIQKIRSLGTISLTTGLGQIIFTAFFGFFLTTALGFDVINALYIAIALTFSSTIIIVKLLSDKQEVDSLHGRIAIGFLIVQDLFVVLVMVALSTAGTDALARAGSILIYISSITLLLALFMRYVATPLLSRIVRTPELLIVFSAGWAAMLAALCSALGFSNELGGLLAGVSLASTPYRETIISRLAPLRDFLLLFFFIALGAQLEFSPLGSQLVPAVVLSLFVLIGNPLIVMAIMGFMGYRKRTGFLAGLTVAQISEFSLILMAMGMKMEHTTKDALSLVTLVGLVTIAVSIYMITYSQELYNWLEPYLGIFERKNPYSEVALEMKRVEKKRYDIILFGLGRYGGAIAEQLLKEHKKILGIDYDPEAVRRWRRRGLDAMHGDAWDHDLIASLKLHDVSWVVSALPQFEFSIVHEDPRLILIDNLRQAGRFRGKIAVSTRSPEEIRQLELKGADIVFLPFYDAAARAVERMREMDGDAKLS